MRQIHIKPDRYLYSRGGLYQYYRRVPRQLEGLDARAPIIRISLQTDDILTARRKRDTLERADGEYWAAMVSGDSTPKDALARYHDAVSRVAAVGFSYRTFGEISELPLDEIVRRVAAVMSGKTPPATVSAVLGTIDRPNLTFDGVLEIYEDKIMAVEIRN